MSRKLLLALAVALGVVLAGCAAPAGAGVTISDAWARSSPSMNHAGAAYMVIQNDGSQADRLVSASSDAAASIELHETTEADGMMHMRPVDGIDVPAGGQAALAPGGLHIMLIGLTRDLQAGDTVALTLTFERAGEVTVNAEVRGE